jgi:hypothetical protein
MLDQAIKIVRELLQHEAWLLERREAVAARIAAQSMRRLGAAS